MLALPPRVEVIGTPISATSYAEVLALLDRRPGDRALVVAVCTVHSVVAARDDPRLAQALRAADVATPDGMPLVWSLRRLGHPGQQRVYGPDLLEAALPYGVTRGWRHYFHGSEPQVLERLTARAHALAPGVRIVGAHSPPFAPPTPESDADAIARIQQAEPDIVWVGLGMPKQELFMARVAARLPGVALVGVGAAFTLVSGVVRQAPDWLQDRGLEWAYRLAQEPGRLWRRYLTTNPRFVVLITRQLLRERAAGQA